MKKLAHLSDVAFACVAAALPALCYLRYRGVTLLWSAIIALLLALGAGLLTWSFLRKKHASAVLKAGEKQQTEKLLFHLALLSPQQQADFFAPRTQSLVDQPTNETVRKAGRWFLLTDSQILYCLFTLAPLTADELLPLLGYEDTRAPVLLCNGLDKSAEQLAEKFSLQILFLPEIYLRLQKNNALPTVYKGERAFAKKKKRRFSLWFQKSNAKPFFTGGVLILLSSLFSPFPYYYLVMGSALVATSAAVRIFGK